MEYKSRNDWLDKINEWKNDYPFIYDEDDVNIYSQDVLKELNKQIKDKSNYLQQELEIIKCLLLNI